jgi:hypothetical protein
MREREHVGLKLKLLLEAKKICAWCKVDLDLPGGTTKGEPTTHGICPGCAKALWAQWMADKAKEREKEQHKPQEEAARDLRFENDLKDKLRAIAEKTKGMDENAVLQEINGIANANGFKVTSEKAIGAKFSIRVKLTPAVPNSDTEITFNFIPESSNYILVYSHSVVGEQDKVKRWARPLAKPITEIKAKVKIPSQPRFDPVDPGFFGKLATGILVWMKHAPSSNEEAAFEASRYLAPGLGQSHYLDGSSYRYPYLSFTLWGVRR